MGRQRRRPVGPTDDREQLELLCVWEEQREYERIRPLVLFGGPVPERSAQTGISQRVLYRKIAAFREEGMESLFGSPKAKLEAVTNPRLFATPYRTTQPKLFALEALGEGGWPKALKLAGYGARARRRPGALQQALFPYLEAL